MIVRFSYIFNFKDNIVDKTFNSAYKKFMFLQLVEIDELLNKDLLLKEISFFSKNLTDNINNVLNDTINNYMKITDQNMLKEKNFW